MVTTHKIAVSLYDHDFMLVAIRCNLKGYSLAYHINKAAGLRLTRAEMDLSFNGLDFPIFEWNDTLYDRYYALVANVAKKEQTLQPTDLFSEVSGERTHYLVKERKLFDYFLKIESEDQSVLPTLVAALNSIDKVATAQQMEANSLKSKKNLIF
ncbi:IPExxxVDY family protein [Croceitalea dokdonensis]|nr:IPExxxVDY family protein [Croceitalea dokdonensis]